MKLYFMKYKAIEFMKANLEELCGNYFTLRTNDWFADKIGFEPFEYFTDIPDFELAPLGGSVGSVDMENVKILYTALQNLSESQAADERLWAGLANGVFYSYVRQRFGYQKSVLKNRRLAALNVRNRFFYTSGGRSGLYTNYLCKLWWVGHSTYGILDDENKWAALECLKPEDFSTKIHNIFYSNTFAANPNILKGICEGIRYFTDRGTTLETKKHIIPTMVYLNAYAGGILLDYLSADEVKTLVVEKIAELRDEKIGDISTDELNTVVDELDTEEPIDDDIETGIQNTNAPEDTEEVNIDYVEQLEEIENSTENFDENEIFGKPEIVERGCKVIVRNDTENTQFERDIPLESTGIELNALEKKMLERRVGDVIRMGMKEYTILDIRRNINT